MNSLQPTRQELRSIPQISSLSYRDFVTGYLNPHQPVIIKDGLKDWAAVGRWSPEFFRARYPGRLLTVDGRQYSMEQFVGLVENSSSESPAPYFRNEMVRLVFPELLPDISPRPSYVLPNWFRGPFYPSAGYEPEIYVGGSGAGFPFLHYDSNSTHAFLCQVFGRKEAVLYAPGDSQYVYPKEGTLDRHHSPIVDVEHPDFEKFPLFAKAVAFRGVLEPCSLLFIPCRWWHTARMLSPSITISYNVGNASNWSEVCDEISYKARLKQPVLVPLVAAYMKLLGQGHALYDFIRS